MILFRHGVYPEAVTALQDCNLRTQALARPLKQRLRSRCKLELIFQDAESRKIRYNFFSCLVSLVQYYFEIISTGRLSVAFTHRIAYTPSYLPTTPILVLCKPQHHVYLAHRCAEFCLCNAYCSNPSHANAAPSPNTPHIALYLRVGRHLSVQHCLLL